MSESYSPGLRLLLLEEPAVGLEIQSGLEATLPATVTGTSSLSQCLAQPLERAALIIADLALLPGNGLRILLDATAARGPAVLVLLRAEDAHRTREVLETGARDCLVMAPGFLESLPIIVRKNLEGGTKNGEREPARTLPPLETADGAIAGLMHRLAGPITAILGSTEALRRSPAHDQTDVSRIYEAGEQCRRVLDGLSRLTRRRTPKKHSVDLVHLLEEMAAARKSTLESKGVDFVWEPPDALPPVLLDEEQIREAIAHLLDNAVDAVGLGRRKACIRLQLGTEGEPSGRKSIAIRVLDNGDGIIPSRREEIWRPFFSRRGEGKLGLGLKLAAAVARAHQGRVSVGSEEGWTRAVLEIPLNAAPAPGKILTDVLVVDDEESVRTVVESVLVGAGFRVRSASSVAEALGAFESAPAGLVVTDLRMPGEGGEELYARLADCGCRFVFMTGDTLSPDTVEFLARGRGVPLPKPFTREDLLNAVATAQ